jgi:hypothetical protein
MGHRALNPFWKLTERFSSEGREMKEACAVLDQFAYNIIDQVRFSLSPFSLIAGLTQSIYSENEN